MAHRDALDALRQTRESILVELAQLELADDADAERAAVMMRLDEVRCSLQALSLPRASRLRSLRIIKACPASWASMLGDHRERHCGTCDRKVYDLTAMMPDEIEAFLASRLGAGGRGPCVRMYARADGRYQEGPCGPATRRTWGRAIALASSLGMASLVAWLAYQPLPAAAALVSVAPADPPPRTFSRADGELRLAPAELASEDGLRVMGALRERLPVEVEVPVGASPRLGVLAAHLSWPTRESLAAAFAESGAEQEIVVRVRIGRDGRVSASLPRSRGRRRSALEASVIEEVERSVLEPGDAATGNIWLRFEGD